MSKESPEAQRGSQRGVRFPSCISPGYERMRAEEEREKGSATEGRLMSSYESGPAWPEVRD